MRRRCMFARIVPSLLLIGCLGACDRPPATPQPRHATAAAPVPSALAPTPTPTATPALTLVTARDPAAVLAGWASAVEARDWKLVRAYWGNHGGDSGFSDSEFAARWGVLQAPKVTLGPADAEGAAGSSYYDAPVMIADGRRRFAGNVVLRRINDIDGASAEDLRWHIQSSSLQP